MFKFRTETGSEYEVNETRKEIRRLAGSHEPTERQGPDGLFKKYEQISPIKVGSGVLIVWETVGNVLRSTNTSAVTQVFFA